MIQTVRFANLTITLEERAEEVIYRFVGDVDENFRHGDVPKVHRPSVVFELSGIRNFNSVGIREWIYLVRDFSVMDDLIFRACSVAMIDQINMVPDSLGSGRIESFFAPYFCDSDACQRELSLLVEVAPWQDFLGSKMAPAFRCDHCQEPLTFDALEESYFLFYNNALPKVG